MPRIEMLMSLTAGACGGLIGVLWQGIASTAWLARLGVPLPADASDGASLRVLVTGAAGRTAAGAMLGLLFWASWSLIALVNLPWYAIGSAFGVACWGGAALPALVTLGFRSRLPAKFVAVIAVEWLVSCLAIGLLCALSWRRIV